MKLAAALFIGLLTASLALAKDEQAPRLSESFAKAGVRAVVIIEDDPNSKRAEEAFQDAKVEQDPSNVY